METERKKLTDQIRAAVDGSGLSRYRIAKELDIPESSMSRFMSGEGGLSLRNLDRLADLLGIEIVIRKRKKKG